MSIHVAIFRGQGVRVQGRGYGVVHRFVSPTEVLVKLRDGFATVQIADLLPVAALDQVAKRYEEYEIELELSSDVKVSRRDDELEEPELTGLEEEPEVGSASAEQSYEEFEEREVEAEMAEEME